MIIKVCGVRDARIAAVAVAAGADWIGVVLVPASPRHADPRACAEVSNAVAGAAAVVGVLVSPTAAECNEAADRYALDAVQLHGQVRRDIVHDVDVPVIRAINVATDSADTDSTDTDSTEMRHRAMTIDWWPDGFLLLDAAPTEPDALPGGTGRRIPLDLAADVAVHRRILLAGGLTPDSVAAAVVAVRPHGVDASSGLESAPGQKDAALVEAFVARARGAAVRPPSFV